MSGGINAWNGIVAEGAYDAGLAYFSGGSDAEEMISLSFSLEEGNRAFYERLSTDAEEKEAASIFRSLCHAEERHKETLRELYGRISGRKGNPPAPKGLEPGTILEGGAPLPETLAWAAGRTIVEILELAIALEANALDRYVKMERAVADERSREVFRALSAEERHHLERMASLLERLRDAR